MNLAIVFGVSDYEHCNNLKACDNDIYIMKNILDKLNKYDDICFIDNSPKAHEVKQRVTEFINKHKHDSIDELFFYFSGHGFRNTDDFFYVLKDFDETKRETTGFRNTELDGLIKNLSPKLTVKIVDACFSGTTYIKSTKDNIEPIFRKSAEENKFKNLYFFYSSSSEEESLANEDISFFSLSFFKSLAENKGEIRYRDIMAYIADYMSYNKYPEPVFILQANNTEFFGHVNDKLITYINECFTTESDSKDSQNVASSEKDKSLLQLITQKANDEYCSKEEAYQNIKLLKEDFLIDKWPKDITDIFNVNCIALEDNFPNRNAIGLWLIENKDEKYFAKPTYQTENYYKEEYVEIPQKPNPYASALNKAMSLGLYGKIDKNYKLEKVEKTRSVLTGFELTTESPLEALQIKFSPKHNSTENYNFTIVPIFSRKNLIIFNSIEVLEYTGWDSISSPKCNDWKVTKLVFKNQQEIIKFCQNKINSITKYILEDIKSKLSK